MMLFETSDYGGRGDRRAKRDRLLPESEVAAEGSTATHLRNMVSLPTATPRRIASRVPALGVRSCQARGAAALKSGVMRCGGRTVVGRRGLLSRVRFRGCRVPPFGCCQGESTLSVQQFKRIVDSGVLERLHHGLYRLARMPEDVHLDGRVERLDQPAPTDCSRIARPPAYTG